MHSLSALNRATNNGERIYAIIRVVVRLSQPVAVDLILRKWICSLDIFLKQHYICIEDRETLAMMAARHTSTNEDNFD
uniref:Uncharacterized protein n=1 Tax=Panagrolaimus sp. ES5 TaxID=591445 RepID=A0AC34F405_9BILA